MAYEVTGEQRQEMLRQIGRMNVLAISGGRVKALTDGIELPVNQGYKVRVRLTPRDYYRVERVLVRGTKEFDKGHLDDVDFEQVANAAYYASCFRNDDNGQWAYGKDKV
jgi:hypothetical protein